jgi:hypothetical protein
MSHPKWEPAAIARGAGSVLEAVRGLERAGEMTVPRRTAQGAPVRHSLAPITGWPAPDRGQAVVPHPPCALGRARAYWSRNANGLRAKSCAHARPRVMGS